MSDELREELEDEIEEKEGESRADKFKRLAPPRVNKVLKALDTLANCSGSGYEYTEEQVEAMFTAIEDCVNETKAKFEKKKSVKKEFSF
ncbi:MAG: hypothetical protein J5525_12660 [Lachnospiraceae bacterium]|nr:hypothetical protein [Lachnospiraceae bacterium]